MKLRIISFTLLFLTSYIFPMAPQPMMMPTEEELIKMNQEIEAFRSSMTQDQRNEFDKQVEELSKIMESMSEKELEEFITTVFNEPQPVSPGATPMPTPAPAPAQPTKPEEPLYKPSTVSTKSIESAKTLIVGLISQLEAFLRKTTLISDLYGSLQTWVPVAMLADKKELTWQELKQEIERLISSLKVILATDPANGHYYYLTSLIEQDSLYQNIVRLNETIFRNEAAIEVTPFGLGELSKESRKATGVLLGAFVQAIYAQQMIAEIQKLFLAFEPQAKKVMEQEESARKRAFEESRRPISQAPMRSGGMLVDDYATGGGYKPGISDLYGYGDSAYVPPAIPAPTPSAYPSIDTTSSPGSKTAASAKPIPGSDAAEKKDKDAAAKKDKADAAPDKKNTDSAEKITEKIEGFLEDCIITIKAKKLDLSVMDRDKQEAVDEIAGKLARIVSRIKTLESVIKDFSTAQKALYTDRIKIIVKDEKDLFDRIISATEAEPGHELRKQIEALFKKVGLRHTPKAVRPRAPQPAHPAAQPTAPVKAPAASQSALRPAAFEQPFDAATMHPAALQTDMIPDAAE
ncbi:hypothetical protein JST99_00140 [Candidatus Dependentiae bacterium]|nr:hypothetical protein [Candidatus Dependentiae bacterium]MCC7414591.1 hypothetical protein [Campylobacterota bacterium]